MSAPLIGITTHSHDDIDKANLDLLLDNIVCLVEQAGGLPILIPPSLQPDVASEIYRRVDGLLLSGGGDINSSEYGVQWHPGVSGVDTRRDRLELSLARQSVVEHRPLFGICRGAQVLNVALGGTLYPALEEQEEVQRHSFYPDYPFNFRSHSIQVVEGSVLAEIIGQPVFMVNSLHHQACRRIAPALRVTAVASDGIVEAIEVPDHPFALAVQWHPEALPDDPVMRRLFEVFVQACADFRL